jgi:plasmid stabilization system protein ParE
MEILWYSKAEQDLNDNISYIAKGSPQNALLVLDKLLKFTDSLVLFPYKYPKEPAYNREDIRFAIKWTFKIIYRVTPDILYILRIFNTRQSPHKINQ